MNALQSSPVLPWLLSYLFNALWQIPLVFAAAWIATRMLRRTDPRIGHRVWVGALFLQVVLPACDLRLGTLASTFESWVPSFWQQRSAASGHVHVFLGPAQAGGPLLHLPRLLPTAIALAYACVVLYFAVRLVWGLLQTRALARGASRLTLTGEAASRWTGHCHRLGIPVPPPEIAASPQGIGPVTVGLRRGLILVPSAFLENIAPNDLDAVLAHELAHIQRRDFSKNLLYGLVSLPIVWHPVVWRARARVAESRELVCDAMAAGAIAAETVAGRRQYAQSLLSIASMLSGCPAIPTVHALGILGLNPDARIFERRIMTLTRKPVPMTGARRVLIATACSVLALATCTSALALRMDVSAPAQAASESQQPKKISIGAGVMTGLKIAGKNPTYPKAARTKKIQGAVVIDAIIGKDGAIKHLHVLKTPDKTLSNSAIKAVRTWRYRPYLLNGEPVEVATTINVVYNLGS